MCRGASAPRASHGFRASGGGPSGAARGPHRHWNRQLNMQPAGMSVMPEPDAATTVIQASRTADPDIVTRCYPSRAPSCRSPLSDPPLYTLDKFTETLSYVEVLTGQHRNSELRCRKI